MAIMAGRVVTDASDGGRNTVPPLHKQYKYCTRRVVGSTTSVYSTQYYTAQQQRSSSTSRQPAVLLVPPAPTALSGATAGARTRWCSAPAARRSAGRQDGCSKRQQRIYCSKLVLLQYYCTTVLASSKYCALLYYQLQESRNMIMIHQYWVVVIFLVLAVATTVYYYDRRQLRGAYNIGGAREITIIIVSLHLFIDTTSPTSQQHQYIDNISFFALIIPAAGCTILYFRVARSFVCELRRATLLELERLAERGATRSEELALILPLARITVRRFLFFLRTAIHAQQHAI